MAVIHRNEVGWHMACDHCGTIFDSKRSTAQFCSSACRTARHRETVAFENRLRDFQQEAARLVRHMRERQFMKSETRRALERVAKTIDMWNTEPTGTATGLSVFGFNAFEFDTPEPTNAKK
jgi:hypothetical protein